MCLGGGGKEDGKLPGSELETAWWFMIGVGA